MAPPDTIGIASTLAGSCISHISKVSESRRKRKDDNYRIALHREFGRFRLWLHGFREPVTGQTIDQRSPDNALDEVLEEATYLKEPTTLLLLTLTSCLLSDHLKNVGDDLTRASLKASLYQTMKIYPHMEKALERQWNARESVITDISDTIDLLFDLAPPLDDVLERIRYPLVPLNGTTEPQREALVASSEVIEEDVPEWTIPLADAYRKIFEKYIQDKFPNASPDLDIDRFAEGNAKCHDRLLAEPEMPMPSELEVHIVEPPSRENLNESLQIGQPAEVQVAATFHDSGIGSSAPAQSIISPSMGESSSMGESRGVKMPTATILQDSSLEGLVSPLLDTASAQKDLKGGTFLAPPPSISGLSQSTLCSQSSTPDKRPSLPAIPQNPPYYCKLCRGNLNQMSKRSRGHQWRKHIFSDLEAYMCIRANCSQRDVFFKSKREWVTHDMTCNQDLPQESERTEPPVAAQCPFCVKEFGANKAGFYNHVAHHMEDIRLFALPPSYRDLTDDFQNSSNTGASSSGMHVDRDGLPTIAEISDSQPYDESKFERYLKANAKADKSFVGDWVLGGSPSHTEGQAVLASGEIQRPIDGSLRMSELIYTSVENDRWLNILAWLSTVEYENHHILSQRRRQEGTGTWLFGNDTFLKWKDSEANSILWIHGIPGSGKTILASSIVDSFRSLSASDDGHAVAYFYCSYMEPHRSDAESILRTLIKQLCINKGRKVPRLVDQLYQMREDEGDANRPLNPEEGTKLIIALSEKYQSTTIIIDALDECDVGTRKSILSSLHKIVLKATRLNVMVISRYDVDINDSISPISGLCYNIDNGDNSSDINLYIDAELDRRCHPSNLNCDYELLLDGKIDPELKALIRSRLQAESNGMFLWVNLQIIALCAARTAGDVKKVLDRMPRALSGTYSQILERIQSQDPNSGRVAMIVLKWLLCALRACTTGCVIQALAIDPGVPNLNDEGLNREISDILGICMGLVEHDEELGIFRFAHPSVQEFLVQESAFERESSNTYVAEACITALLYHHGDESSIPELYSYAMEYWGDHVRLSGVTTGALATHFSSQNLQSLLQW
ncbi:hypothetical protein DFP73DRAFT_345177 [Morchella snyderi]|nr:hypothetical protein DFP73DRAFT_345177 [Morchella snyderi]